MRRNSTIAYGLLGILWVAVVIWQMAEHRRLEHAVEEGLLNRAHDISTSLAVVIRSQRRMGSVPRPRLEGALQDLVKSRELLGIALLNPSGEVVAAAGQSMQTDLLAALAPGMTKALPGRLVTAALVELGPEWHPPGRTRPEGWHEDEGTRTNTAVVWTPDETPPSETPPPGAPPGPGTDTASTPPPAGPPAAPDTGAESAFHPPEPLMEPGTEPTHRPRWARWSASHPFGQSPEQYKELYEKQGLHMMALMLNHVPAGTAIRQDLILRLALGAVALAAALGLAMAWRNVSRSTDLQLRLARARAMNSYLRELNLAAAGLAHETRNPLNIVRGIAQMVTRDNTVPEAARTQLGTAIEEVDRITARLNEFIDYSKPRDPHLAAVSPVTVARDVARTLQTDLEDKHVTFSCEDHATSVMADAAMLRQVLFNLLLNAVQAVPAAGRIEVRLIPREPALDLEVIDNGPGVPAHVAAEIFRPYFTLSATGSGLGLAVVRQIVLAHGWEISYLPNPTGGSIFRLSGLEASGKRDT